MNLKKIITAGLLSLSALTIKAQTLEDYQSTRTLSLGEKIYTVSNEPQMAPVVDFIDIPTLDIYSTTESRRFRILPSDTPYHMPNNLPNNTTLVGLGESQIKTKYSIISPIEKKVIIADSSLHEYKNNLRFVNLNFIGDNNVVIMWIENCKDILFFNNYFEGRGFNKEQGGFPNQGLSISLTEKPILENNVFSDFYRIRDDGNGYYILQGTGMVLSTNNNDKYKGIFRNNIFTRNGVGIDGTKATALDIGNQTTSGDNAFVNNLNYNLKLDITDDQTIDVFAKNNTWFRTIQNQVLPSKSKISTASLKDIEQLINQYPIVQPLDNISDIAKTIQAEGYTLVIPSQISLQSLEKRLFLVPFNSYDPLNRVGERRNEVKGWRLYE